MSGRRLDGLSAEILQHITGYLHDYHKPSLASFSLASKACHAAARIWLFRNIRFEIDVKNPTELQEQAAKWAETLHRTRSEHHVRQIEIVDPKEEKKVQTVFHSDGPFRPWDREKDKNWLPIAELIGLMSNVTDLIYKPNLTLPPCLLKVIHEKHPKCRLHILRFRFKSLHEATVDQHELAIATSPCLYSVAIRHTDRDTNAMDDWNQEAQLRLVAGMAPNLKEVRSRSCRAVSSGRLSLSRGTPRQPWPGFSHEIGEPSPGALERLSLNARGGSSWDSLNLDGWHKATDFSALRFLELSSTRGPVLNLTPENIKLPNLKELRLWMYKDGSSEETGSSCLASFFSILPPLETLDYYGKHGEVLDSVLESHGSSLQKLTLHQCLDLLAMRQLSEKCLRLEDLKVTAKRSLSDETEVSTYMALGRIRRLADLILVLDCSESLDADPARLSNHTPSAEQSWQGFDDDAFDREVWRGNSRARNGHVRNAMLNSAVDEALARSIWDTINEAKEGRALHSLKLQATGVGWFGFPMTNKGFNKIVRYMSQSYLLERITRDDDEYDVTIRELGKYTRDTGVIQDEEDGLKESEDVAQRGPALEVFRRIWPKKEGSVSWRDDWSSLPLRK